ncbi:hypothetical protein GDO81_011232 [Engystomops pustulosus]|uniref:Uncharacterized protein n=1 Tax=Engystomops pustulosus TaxID=76066 RepID=A0AAV7BCN0_ENGPU|nr:hypothetical protein GDO81_011232 [Engystomops pustulosus]
MRPPPSPSPEPTNSCHGQEKRYNGGKLPSVAASRRLAFVKTAPYFCHTTPGTRLFPLCPERRGRGVSACDEGSGRSRDSLACCCLFIRTPGDPRRSGCPYIHAIQGTGARCERRGRLL